MSPKRLNRKLDLLMLYCRKQGFLISSQRDALFHTLFASAVDCTEALPSCCCMRLSTVSKCKIWALYSGACYMRRT
jgi:hypothetical protein